MPDREPYRALVVGCGRIGSLFDEQGAPVLSSHAGAYRAEPRTRLVGLCDVNMTRARNAGDFWGVPWVYTSVSAALEATRPDIVSICTPDDGHDEVLRTVLSCESVRAVLAEKPLAADVQAARDLAEEARRRQIALAVNYSRRFQPAYRQVIGEIAGGRIGKIRAICGYYSRGIKHNGTHWIDLASWIAGRIVRVQATDAVMEWPQDPTLDIRIEFRSGVLAYLKGMDQRDYAIFEMDVLGDRGRLRITRGPRFVWSERRESEVHPGFAFLENEREQAVQSGSATAAAVANVCDVLEGSGTLLCGAKEAIEALEVADACLRSAEEGIALPLRHDL